MVIMLADWMQELILMYALYLSYNVNISALSAGFWWSFFYPSWARLLTSLDARSAYRLLCLGNHYLTWHSTNFSVLLFVVGF
jgi:hypothetical protein